MLYVLDLQPLSGSREPPPVRITRFILTQNSEARRATFFSSVLNKSGTLFLLFTRLHSSKILFCNNFRRLHHLLPEHSSGFLPARHLTSPRQNTLPLFFFLLVFKLALKQQHIRLRCSFLQTKATNVGDPLFSEPEPGFHSLTLDFTLRSMHRDECQ